MLYVQANERQFLLIPPHNRIAHFILIRALESRIWAAESKAKTTTEWRLQWTSPWQSLKHFTLSRVFPLIFKHSTPLNTERRPYESLALCSELAGVIELQDIVRIIRKRSTFTFLEVLMDCFTEWQSMKADKQGNMIRQLPTYGAAGNRSSHGQQKWESRFLGHFAH